MSRQPIKKSRKKKTPTKKSMIYSVGIEAIRLDEMDGIPHRMGTSRFLTYMYATSIEAQSCSARSITCWGSGGWITFNFVS
jgi:hypothetical protein